MKYYLRILGIILLLFATGSQAVVVSRLQLDHPALGTAGGTSLHSSIETIYTKIGDNMDSRFFTQDALANSSSVDFIHNFKTAFSTLRYELYIRNTGTGELTQVTATSSPSLSQFTIAATVSFLTTRVTVTNSSGSSRDIALVVHHDNFVLDAATDVNLTTTAPAAADSLYYDASATSWIPASGKFNKFVDPSRSGSNFYATLTAATVTAGDRILVVGNYTITSGETISASNVLIEFLPNVKITINAAITGLTVSGNDVQLVRPQYISAFSGTVTAGISLTGNSCNLDRGKVESNSAGTTITDAFKITGTNDRVVGEAKATTGTITNTITDSGTNSDFMVR